MNETNAQLERPNATNRERTNTEAASTHKIERPNATNRETTSAYATNREKTSAYTTSTHKIERPNDREGRPVGC